MINFLLKGLFRDRSRSLFPILIVSLSVAIVVLGHAYIEGAMGDIVEVNAKFDAGHVKIMTKAYEKQQSLRPNDMALTGISSLTKKLAQGYPNYDWLPRIKFGGLLDFPDKNGETIAQGSVAGIGAHFISKDSQEIDNLSLRSSLAKGRLIEKSGEALVSDQFFNSLGLKLGQRGTLIGSSMEGGTAVANFTIVGTVKFGVGAMDRGALLADISDVQNALYMDDAASEILGFHQKGFDQLSTETIQVQFNERYAAGDQYSPVMKTIRDQEGFATYIDLANYMGSIMVVIFTFIITLVLWNSGIRNGIRRYSEFGIRLAIGEDYQHVYFTQVAEAFAVGLIGSILGTLIGLAPAYYLQENGIDISGMMDSSTSAIMMQDVIKAKVTSTTLWIGMVPGILSTVAGALIAGLGIFKRNTAQLFKELEI
jgi:putative ABC transport system permease protein